MIVSATGYESVTTHVFVEGDPYLESDAVFGVKNSLVAPFVRHESGVAPDGKRMDQPYYTVRYEFGLLPVRVGETVA
jgi:hydroxyquinol 1,2-dioxygenase